ncbi:Bug family tripartite tricarboxylate transporter substrate binding protein [Parapusillimonas granuli]|nr:tripartite tricarboxylate transporter substrate binding protein [Parapusillimonas granuli]MBB5214430.1 tripartite-type tricarboxylate transporter receptor subunit TctC [Parapusillimonas granuli]
MSKQLIGIMVRTTLAASLLFTAAAQAQAWPGSKPVTIVVPSAPGGAGGIIGTAAAKNAAADGHTFLLSTNSTQSANQFLYKSLPYDAAKDFVDIGMIGKFGTVAVVAPNSPIKDLKELVDLAKKKPGEVFFGYYSSSSQVPPNLLKQYADINTEGAAYKNITQILTDLRGGLIQFAFVDYLTAKGQIDGGNLKPIAVTGAQPNPLWPNVPTTDSIYPGFVVEGWLGISAPAGTPKEVVAKMNGYLKAAVGDKATREQLTNMGLQPEAMDVDAFGQYVRDDTQRWKEWVKTAKIQPQ